MLTPRLPLKKNALLAPKVLWVFFISMVFSEVNAQDSLKNQNNDLLHQNYNRSTPNHLNSEVSKSNQQNFINRIHHHFYNHSKPYHYLYNRFWAVDTSKAGLESQKKEDLIAFPFLSYAPETSLEFGFAGAYTFYTHLDSITRGSSQTAKISYTLNHQYSIELNPDIWTSNNKYHFTGAIQYQSFPSFFYGIGYNTLDSNKLKLDYKQLFLDIEVEKELFTHFRAGIILILSNHDYDFASNALFFQKYTDLYAEKGGTAFFTGLSFVYDTRNILNFTTKGTYLRFAQSINLPKFSSLNTLVQMNFSAIQYIPFTKKSTLGLNLVSNNIIGNQIPFYLLNLLGGSNLERGYYRGRFRDKSLLAAQAEFKYHFIPRLAVAAFAGLGTTWGYERFDLHQLKPSLGGGIHYILSIPNQLSLRLDYGIGQKLSDEPRFHGFYFALSEAF